jgi:methionyl-tRNA formyltransferase
MAPLQAVSQLHTIVALVKPASSQSLWGRSIRNLLSRSGIGEQAAMAMWARHQGVPLLEVASRIDPGLVERLKSLASDVICVSGFPWLLRPEILSSARMAAFNVHTSLLPRHRGPNPLLWVYYHNDERTGVTVHLMNQRADAGDILAQQAFDLPRGFLVERLYSKTARIGARLLVQALNDLETGNLKPKVQDESLSTYAPRVPQGVAMVDFREWDVERIWHFMSALCSRRREPLRDTRRKEIRYHSVLGYTVGDCRQEPGTLRSAPFGWNLYCQNGSIQLGRTYSKQEGEM